jgi:predicted DNA-binding protein
LEGVPRKISITAMIEIETYNRLLELSRQTGKSMSEIIREAIERHVAEVK